MNTPRLDPGLTARTRANARTVRRDPAAPSPAALPTTQQIDQLVQVGPPALPAGASARARLAHGARMEAWLDAWAIRYAHLTGLFCD
jgi:hypothetical protein